MSRSANVLSTQALKDFKVAMANFAEEAQLPGRSGHGAAPHARLARARPARLLAVADQETVGRSSSRRGPISTASTFAAGERRRIRRRPERGRRAKPRSGCAGPKRRSRWSSG